MSEQQVNLSLRDLNLMSQIIQASVQRGAIKAEEMEVVGNLFNRLTTFINSANKSQEPKATEEPVKEK